MKKTLLIFVVVLGSVFAGCSSSVDELNEIEIQNIENTDPDDEDEELPPTGNPTPPVGG